MREETSQELQRLRVEQDTLCNCLESAGYVSSKAFTLELRKVERVNANAAKKQSVTSIVTSTPGRTGFSSSPGGVPSSTQSRRFSIELQLPADSPAAVRSLSAPTRSSGSRSRTPSGARRSQLQVPAVPLDPNDLFSISQPLLTKHKGPETPLCKQIQKKALAEVEAHIRKNATPDKWAGPATPLHGALKAGSRDLVHLLIDNKADVNASDEKGVGVLHHACFNGQVDFVTTLLESQADPNQQDRHGQTPLFFAPTRAVCEMLFQHLCDTNLVNTNGQSALHLAGRAGFGEVLLWMSKNVPRAFLELKDIHGWSPADYARRSKIPESVLKRLVYFGDELLRRQDRAEGYEERYPSRSEENEQRNALQPTLRYPETPASRYPETPATPASRFPESPPLRNSLTPGSRSSLMPAARSSQMGFLADT